MDVTMDQAGRAFGLPQAAPIPQALLRLHRWPDLAQFAEDQQPVMARLCALLAHRPSARILVAPLLSIPRDQAEALLDRLQREGCLASGAEVESASTRLPDPMPRTLAPSIDDADRMLSKLWSLLTRRR